MKKDALITCRGCGAENGERQGYCVACGKNLSAEQIEINRSVKRIEKEEEKKEKFDINSFLKQNIHFFTLIGIFGALSFYLTNLIPKTVGDTINISGTCTFFLGESVNESPNSSILIDKLVNGSFLGTGGIYPSEMLSADNSFFFISPAQGLQIGVLTCYCFLFLFIFAILIELSKYDECYLVWVFHSLFIIFIFVTGSYLINNYSLSIVALSFTAIAMTTMIIYRVRCVHILSDDLTTKETKEKKLYRLLGSSFIILLALYLITVFVKNPPLILWIFVTSLTWGVVGGSFQMLAVLLNEVKVISRTLRHLIRR